MVCYKVNWGGYVWAGVRSQYIEDGISGSVTPRQETTAEET